MWSCCTADTEMDNIALVLWGWNCSREEFRRNLGHLHEDISQLGNEDQRINAVLEEYRLKLREYEDALQQRTRELQFRNKELSIPVVKPSLLCLAEFFCGRFLPWTAPAAPGLAFAETPMFRICMH